VHHDVHRGNVNIDTIKALKCVSLCAYLPQSSRWMHTSAVKGTLCTFIIY